jgi:hypothetical protein
MANYKFNTGCLWEGGGFEIQINLEVDENDGDICKHCHSKHIQKNERFDGTFYYITKWICPKVVVALNEGGYNSTGVCLDCIIEANETIKI